MWYNICKFGKRRWSNMTNKKRYLVVNNRFKAVELAKAGFEVVFTKLDKKYEGFFVYMFERTEELDKLAIELGIMKSK
ncbi:MAG: hypothetical protein ACRCTZ_16150 [Sarcina sp.]